MLIMKMLVMNTRIILVLLSDNASYVYVYKNHSSLGVLKSYI